MAASTLLSSPPKIEKITRKLFLIDSGSSLEVFVATAPRLLVASFLSSLIGLLVALVAKSLATLLALGFPFFLFFFLNLRALLATASACALISSIACCFFAGCTFKQYGAKLESAKEASDPRSIVQKKGMHLNDVCWNCWPGNYFRYIKQIDPTETSVGWWRVGPKQQGYGRFARGLEHATGRKLITLQLDPKFKTMNATATVVYFNAGRGSWSIAYNGETKGTIVKTSTDSWITTAKIPLGSISGNGKITLFSPDQKDSIFSLLEILQVN